MACKEDSGMCAEYYINSKGYTREQIDDFDTDRAVTMFLSIEQGDDRAEWHQQSGTLLFSESQKRNAEGEQQLREDPVLANAAEAFLAIVRKPAIPIFDRQPQTPPELLFDGIHKGEIVYIAEKGKARTKKIVFPHVSI
jgi:hypothetical protein